MPPQPRDRDTFADARTPRAEAGSIAALVLIPGLCASLVGRFSTFTMPMGGYWSDAVALAKTGRIPQDFTPAGYPELIAAGVRLMPGNPVAGVVLIQVLLHIAIAITLWACLRALKVGPALALGAALLLQLHPELILSVAKVWDVPYSTFLLLLLELCLLLLVRRRPSVALLVGTGVAFGLGVFERPNFALLAVALGIAMWFGRSVRDGDEVAVERPRPSAAFVFGVPVAVAAGVYILSALLAFHRIDAPHNGPYNVFAGHNQGTREALLNKLNAEPSLIPALAADGYAMSDEAAHQDAAGPLFSRLAKQYALTHPGEELALPGVKLYTLLRPDSKLHGLNDREGKVKALLSMAIPLWIVVLIWRWRGLNGADWLLVLMAALYVAPFLLTNSDPRFRTPLDLMVLTHAVALIAVRNGLQRGAVRR